MSESKIITLFLIGCVATCLAQDAKYCIPNDNMDMVCTDYDSLKQGPGSTMQRYIVNLNLSYQERWKYLITKFKNPIQNLYKFVESKQKVQELKSQVPLYADPEFLNEVKAIADLSGTDFGTAQIVSQMYETFNSLGCTSILSRDWSGNIIHARNLDYGFEKYISPLLTQIDFQRDGKTVFMADMVLGTAIVVTGIVPNGFSITINQREDNLKSISYLQKQYIPACYLIYQVLQTKTTFDDAIAVLRQTNIAMQAYLNVAGTTKNQGIVIERDREGINDETSLSESTWYICQTNYDRKQEDPANDYRRIPCEQKMNKLNKNTFQINDIYNILQEKPSLVYFTVTTDIMIPKTSYFNSTRWFNSVASSQVISIAIIFMLVFICI